jgi:membrane-associated protein
VLDFFLHADRHLLDLVATYGAWVYGLLFAIVFAETGFVVTPFCPAIPFFSPPARCARRGR